MDLVSWTLNVIDQFFFFFQREDRVKETIMSRRDVLLWIHNGFLAAVEDCVPDYDVGRGHRNVYIFRLLMTGFLLFGAGGYLAYRVIRKTWTAAQSIPKLPAMLDGVCLVPLGLSPALVWGVCGSPAGGSPGVPVLWGPFGCLWFRCPPYLSWVQGAGLWLLTLTIAYFYGEALYTQARSHSDPQVFRFRC
ncbi:hypothetical protein GOODEAATRI_023028 [Goodea atripinnis]|uniref:Uncharacterized protein n=1 Tax=Goodea atripinnis TaxID=208336 RepID=A0ABV0PQY9_9TELE